MKVKLGMTLKVALIMSAVERFTAFMELIIGDIRYTLLGTELPLSDYRVILPVPVILVYNNIQYIYIYLHGINLLQLLGKGHNSGNSRRKGYPIH
jgi:hypothetical protein